MMEAVAAGGTADHRLAIERKMAETGAGRGRGRGNRTRITHVTAKREHRPFAPHKLAHAHIHSSQTRTQTRART